MKILAFDTCNGRCSVALQINNKICSFIEEKQISMQSARIVLMMQQALKDHKIDYADLDYLAVNIGPGSFTGIRIGISVAKAIKLVTQLPIIGVSGLLSLACSINTNKIYKLSAMDARRSQVYVQLFDEFNMEISDALLLNYDQIDQLLPDGEFILIGDGSVNINSYLSKKHSINPINNIIDANMIMSAANYIIALDRKYDNCSPLYIRSEKYYSNLNT